MLRLTGRSISHASASLSAIALSLAALSACSDSESTTDLNPEGPPMVRQVFVQETFPSGSVERIRTGLAFGDHPNLPSAFDDDDRQVTTAVSHLQQKVRVVVDELLVGNSLEELACADGSFSRVPIGSTPDDVADCAGTPPLPKCESICVGAGGAVGILDANFDGAADDIRMIDYGDGELGVSLICGGQRMPLDPQLSFYNPSGNQQVPAGTIGVDGLGPALILVPTTALGLQTGVACTVTFRPEVTDKDGNLVCAPTDGDIDQGCPTDGDTSKISFDVEGLKLASSDPKDGKLDIDPGEGAASLILLSFNASIDADTLSAISLTADGVDVVIETTVQAEDLALVRVNVPAGFDPSTDHVLTVSTALTDVFGSALPQAATVSFTTNAGGGTEASLDLGTLTADNFDTVVQAKATGAAGNAITVQSVGDSPDGDGVTITETATTVVIHFEDGVSTVADAETAIATSTIIEVKTAGAAANVLDIPGDDFPATNLTGGN